MAIQLGTLTHRGTAGDRQIQVWSGNYDADELWLSAGDDTCQVKLFLDLRQLQELSTIIDQFLNLTD